jgi:UDP-N-acetylglucosamine transferase subunit ALG13
MMFVSVGAQMPFDRLICTVDQWAGLRRRSDVFAQIGKSNYCARHIETTQFVDAIEFRRLVGDADIVVSHAGMGSIITALEFGKPMIVMPRRGDFYETRNDHQVATARHFSQNGRLTAAFTEEELIDKLDKATLVPPSERIDAQAPIHLIKTIRGFLQQRTEVRRPVAPATRANTR